MKVRLENLTKQFPSRGKDGVETTAVNNFTYEIPDGKLIGLLGPSGCGKSTTLFMLSGLQKPSSGKIFFGEDDVTNLTPEKRGVGLVFQNYALYPHLTVLQNILFPLENLKVEKTEALRRAKEMADLVGIGELLNRKPSQLSGGQQQRVAIARALVKMPQVLLLDEPLSNLDARLRLQTREEIKRIQKETGITTIFVTHDQEEAMSISDEIVVMNFGVVQQIGKPQEVYNEPINMFVAKFLGTPPINIIPASVLEGKIAFFEDELKEEIPNEILEEGKVLNIGLRPEFVRVDPNGKYEVYVELVEYIGRDKTLIFKFKGQNNTYKAIIPSDNEVEPGQIIKIDFKKFFIFDEEGNRLV